MGAQHLQLLCREIGRQDAALLHSLEQSRNSLGPSQHRGHHLAANARGKLRPVLQQRFVDSRIIEPRERSDGGELDRLGLT